MSERFTAQELAMLANPAYIGSHQPWVGELDLVNVVRCRDCRYASYDSRWCYRQTNVDALSIRPDGFCAWGERK